jgi:Uma2 family endonuclease
MARPRPYSNEAIMASSTSTLKWTYEDYLLFPEDGNRHELIEGERYMSPSPITRHQKILINILKCYLKRTISGHIFCAPMDVVLSETNVVQPDLLWISSTRAFIITEKNIQGAPDLIIEILSDSTRKIDKITKRKLYEQFGVLEYWIIDPVLETVRTYRMTDGRYQKLPDLSLEANETLVTPLLPDLQIPLSEIFE